ncbi:FAR1-related sequence 2 [Prunus dulcis]|uniref:Protein FAR1-RELATED SEQUENCE n=1 Tax=Prunus dulcis TaxID=3755 RepID=A0A4Y1R7H0_PRUDU|nr:FAR1-related sequence 2 [Prunus dulcis]
MKKSIYFKILNPECKIDLELPSCEQDKLETGSDKDVNVVDVTDEKNVEEHVNSPTTSEHVKEADGLDANLSACSLQAQDDAKKMGLNAVDEGKRVIQEPQNGLEFESKEEAYSYYREYARFGSKRESGTTVNPRLCITKTDCKASLHIKRKDDGKWVVHSFIKEHNHEMCPDDFIYAISGRNKKPATVVCQKKGLQSALVFFDTYYVRNNYRIPFVPIVGVNHHFQYILLGCALMGEETIPAFVWLMRTWLKVVGGQAPRLIITDQDKYLKEAVADENEIFMEKFNKCIYRSWTVEQFEKKWWKLVDRFELRENAWVHSLFEDRKKYISQEATVNDFIEQYKGFQKDMYDMEVEVLGLASCQLQKDGENEATAIFRVDDLEERQNFTVSWNEAELKRWTKDAKVRCTVSDGPKRLNYRVQRFNDLCKLAVKLGEEGSLSPETYHIAFQALEAALKHCVDANNSVRTVSEANMSANHGFNDAEEVNPSSNMAKSSKKKKTYKKRKAQTEQDSGTIRLQDSCQQMEQMKSRAHNRDNCYVPQQESKGNTVQDLVVLIAITVLNRGQLNSIAPISDGYYGNQQATQGQLLHYQHVLVIMGPSRGQLSFRSPTVQSCFDIQGNLQDMEQSAGSSHFHGNASKRLHVNFCNSIANATVDSMRANWSPTHFLGPPPKGKKAKSAVI